MAQWFFDDDGDLGLLEGLTIGIFGYGNQGRSQALNMRDSGLTVIVGSREDESSSQASADGFTVMALAEAAVACDVLFVLVPDEVMPAVYEEHLAPGLAEGNVLVFASGYNVHFKRIVPPAGVDAVLLAPRMVGKGVRDTFIEGTGFPSLIGVAQDASGSALERTVALAKAIGSTRMGVIMSSFEEETIVDLFHEQWGFVYAIRRAFEVLTEAGCSPEAVMLELYASGELMEMAGYFRDIGLFHQMPLHSRTSQFGQQVIGNIPEAQAEADRDRLRGIVEGIRDGSFAQRWTTEQETDGTALEEAHAAALAHPMVVAERELYKVLGRIPTDD